MYTKQMFLIKLFCSLDYLCASMSFEFRFFQDINYEKLMKTTSRYVLTYPSLPIKSRELFLILKSFVYFNFLQ